MVHRTSNNIIRTNEAVYRASPSGNLGRNRMVSTVIPLQMGFYGNRETRFSIRIHDKSAFLAPEQGVVGTAVSGTHSTAAGTPFARVPSINDVQTYIIVKTSRFEDFSKSIEGDSHDLAVEVPTYWLELIEVFDCNLRIETVRNDDDFPDDLSEVRLDIVPLGTLHPCELLPGVHGLQFRPSLHEMLPFDPDILSKIGLIEYPVRLGVPDRDREVSGIDVNPEDVPAFPGFLVLFGKISDDFTVHCQPECLAFPSVNEKTGEPPVVPVLFDWNRDLLSRIETELHEEVLPGTERLAVAGDIEFHGQTGDRVTFLSPCVPYEGASDLYTKGGALLAC